MAKIMPNRKVQNKSESVAGIEIDTSNVKEEFDIVEKKQKKRRPVPNQYIQRYRQFWETDDKFKDWITSVKDDAGRAYCIYCECTILAHRSTLMNHRKTLKHINSSPFQCSSPVEQSQTLPSSDKDLEETQTPIAFKQSTPATASASIISTPTKSVMVEDRTEVIGSASMNNLSRQVEKDDEYDIFGKSVAMQLRRIHPTMRDDVMFNMNSQLYNALKAEIVYSFPTE